MALTERGQELRRYLDNPNVQAYLDAIGKSEGADYRTEFGGGRIEDLSHHPDQLHEFTTTTGQTKQTSAAGKYQFLKSTWDGEARRLGLSDFSPESQDLAAVDLIARNGALDDIAEGRFADATGKLGSVWASLPSSTYNQPTRSAERFRQMLTSSLDDQVAQGKYGVAQPDFDSLAVEASPGGTPPAWSDSVASIQNQSLQSQESSLEPWEDRLLSEALGMDVDDARRQAQADFFGDTISPNVQLPKPLERAISAAMADV